MCITEGKTIGTRCPGRRFRPADLSKEQIKDLILTFLPEKSNEARLIDNIDSYINKLIDYHFLRKLSNQSLEYEVKRILKARITVDTLQEIKKKLYEYALAHD